MIRFYVICLVLSAVTKRGDSHSLWVFATYILGDTQFPPFNVVLMLDDVQVGFFYSNETGLINTRPSSGDNDTQYLRDGSIIFEDMFQSMRRRVHMFKDRLNSSEGLNVQQRLVGCEISDQDQDHQMMSSDAFNGVKTEKLQILSEESYSLESTWSMKLTKTKVEFVKHLYISFYLPVCIKTLKTFLKKYQKVVLRRVKPRLRLFQSAESPSGSVKITCLATGFYPRHINLTILRDGQPAVSDHQISGGELLPNGDETYQMRKSLEVSTEELQQHRYTCAAQHLGLDNKLNIDLDHHRELNTTTLSLSVLGAVAACLLGTSVVIIICCKRKTGKGSQTSLQSNYSPTQSSEREEIEGTEL
ncbi:DLA class I histocompatibility antigen, A9/A9 alpha chain-like [Engraulis encrasicolus]|uniref:DLA class I histocompatibility antigen, A9/A9 alpha chain-like n=1 Tax=Engraulis encrasicolus TaxID=184585 RepID=UPI002FCF49CC